MMMPSAPMMPLASWPLAHGDRHLHWASAADDAQRDRFPNGLRVKRSLNGVGMGKGVSVYGHQNIPQQDAGPGRRTIGFDTHDHQPSPGLEPQLRPRRLGQHHRLHPQAAVAAGMVRDMCRDSPDVLIPSTRPAMSTSGPPEKPG